MKGKKVFVTLAAFAMMFAMGIPAMASAFYKTVYLLPNQVWTDRTDNPGTRSGNYSYVLVTCHAVYPESGVDTYSKMQVVLADRYNNNISKAYVITETYADNKIPLLEGSLNTTEIYYKFRGNSSNDAFATISYNDK